MSPIAIDPTSAPGRLPSPPSTTMTKAVSTKYWPTVGNTGYCATSRPDASPTSAAPMPNASTYVVFTLTPISEAA